MSSGPAKAPSSRLQLGLAGCGKIGSAMAKAWAQSFHIGHIDIFDPNGIPGDLQSDKISAFTSEADFLKHAESWNVLVLAVKPQVMDQACAGIAPALPKNTAVLSIAAGKPIAYFEKMFGDGQSILRGMPNTPASIGKGMSVLCANGSAHETHRDNAQFLLSCLGKVEWTTDESLMDAVTAVSGSGPAYVFYLIEALAAAGVKSGLEPDFAMTLARQTVIGAAALAEMETLPASTLRENVTSPNGTTAAALFSLMDGRFQELMNEAVAKATARGKELSK